MFNALEYRAASAGVRLAVQSGDNAWRMTVHLRWADFMAARIAAALKTLVILEGRAGDKGVNPQKIAIYCTRQRLITKVMLADAEAIRYGRKALPDPVAAEATLRLYEAAAAPRRAA